MDTPASNIGPHAPAKLKTLLALAWPIIVSRASQTVVGLSDAIMVAELGASALAATATGATNAFTLFIFPLGVVFIVSSFSSQLFGRGDVAGARRYGWYGLIVAAATQVLCVAAIAGVDPVLSLLPYTGEVRGLMSTYLMFRLLSGGASIAIEALANYFGGLGRTRPGMVANVAAMLLNIVANWVLIYGNLGAPKLGVAGAAIASSLATWVAGIGFIVYFVREGRGLPRPKLSWHELGRMLRFGLPSGLNWFFEFLAFIFFINVVLGGLGTASVAAMNAVLALNSVSFMPAFGLASAGAILVGQAIGANAKHEVPRAVRLTGLTAATWQGLVGVLYLVIPATLMIPFARGEGADEVLRVGVQMLYVSAAWQLFDATATTMAESLRAAGDTVFPLMARLVIAWLVFVPGAYFSVRSFGWSSMGATFWLALYLALLAVALVVRFRGGAWKSLQLIEPSV